MTPEQLAAIQARADAATEGPWEAKPVRIGFGGDPEREPDFWEVGDNVIYEESDAEFIANARTDVPALLARVREQQARIERVLSMVSVWESTSREICSGGGNISTNFAVTRIRAALTATEGAA